MAWGKQPFHLLLAACLGEIVAGVVLEEDTENQNPGGRWSQIPGEGRNSYFLRTLIQWTSVGCGHIGGEGWDFDYSSCENVLKKDCRGKIPIFLMRHGVR